MVIRKYYNLFWIAANYTHNLQKNKLFENTYYQFNNKKKNKKPINTEINYNAFSKASNLANHLFNLIKAFNNILIFHNNKSKVLE